MKESKQSYNITSEFNGNNKSFVNKFLNDGIPDFSPEQEFKDRLDNKIKNKISSSSEQKINQEIMDSIPKKLKRRFYLTGYGYAVCSFLVLFLIGFCTNIFTGTLKIPSKYTNLEQTQAFGNLHENIQELKGINNNVNEFLTNGNIDNKSQTNSKMFMSQESQSTDKVISNSTDSFIVNYSNVNNSAIERDVFIENGFNYNETYRFTYKEKLFPKLNSEYPVYKSNGVLIGSNSTEQLLKNFKVGDVQFGKFQNIEIKKIEINQKIKNGYYIEFDKDSSKLNIYPNNTWQSKSYNDKLPSNKNILKNIEKDIRLLGVSLKNYSDGVVDSENFDKDMGVINVFYPFKIQGKSLWNPGKDSQIGMMVAYDLNLKKIVSITGIDIASYNVSNYPSINREILESDIAQGGSYFKQGAIHKDSTPVLFDKLEIVYIENITESGDLIYIPAIRGSISSSLENYTGPYHIYKEII